MIGIFLLLARSAIIQRIILAVIMGGLIFGFRDRVFHAFGIGIVILVVAIFALDWAIRGWRIFILIRHWNRYLGAIVLGVASFGILAFFVPDEGVFHDASLGGQFGLWVVGTQEAIGVLRVVGLVIVGIAFIAPRRSWRVVVSLAGRFSRPSALDSPPATISPEVNQSESPTTVADTEPAVAINKTSPEERPREVSSLYTTPRPQGRWQLPPINLFDKPRAVEYSEAEVERRARMIEDALASYGVEARVVRANVGPAVTQFGVEPGWERKYRQIKERDKNGKVTVRREEVSQTRVKVERISSLASNLALALSASSVRVEAPIPGTSMVGIEIPNISIGTTYFREAIESAAYQRLSAQAKLAIVLGKGASGEIVTEDLAKMPHLLISGATGSGKSVCLNAIIASLIMNATPEELQFLMIDPKRVELVSFNSLPHLRSRVVIENERAVDMLTWLNQEMDNRYREMNRRGTRNIGGYNRSKETTIPLPYLILIVDELADLMMTQGAEIEPLLCRLAQMGRATGIHLVVATQRPSVDVVTGIIKANFPTRISFAVASQVDSRTVLDCVGAEKLLGRGDMLYLPVGISKPKRLQGCYIPDNEIDKLVSFWSRQVPVKSPLPQIPKEPPIVKTADITSAHPEGKEATERDSSTHAPQ